MKHYRQSRSFSQALLGHLFAGVRAARLTTWLDFAAPGLGHRLRHLCGPPDGPGAQHLSVLAGSLTACPARIQ